MLYFRMLFLMIVSLFTSRVVLKVLGVDDYGIYQVVGGVVGFLGFLNVALTAGSSRFLTYHLGEGNYSKLQRTFSTTLTIHLALAILLVLIAETYGLWFVYNKLLIAPDKMEAAVWGYHLSIVCTFMGITQVPYGASIVAHERMNIYAYTGIADVVLKLLIVYLLYISPMDKLKFYSLLLAIQSLGIMLFERYYCISRFSETRYKFVFDKELLKQIGSFSGWSLFANLSIALNTQGMTILTNMFFSPSVVTARAVAGSVSNAANQFVQNFRTAVNPQIIKTYAAGDREASKNLLLSSTRYSFYLMFLLGLPILLLADQILYYWLGQVPDYAPVFLQLTIVQALFSIFDSSFYVALYAKGRLKENALISPLVGFIQFPVVYILFRQGYSPVALSWAAVVSYAILGLVIKPVLICRIVGYDYKEIMVKTVLPSLKVVIVASILPIVLRNILIEENFLNFMIIGMSTVCIVIVVIYYVGLDSSVRKKLKNYVHPKLKSL